MNNLGDYVAVIMAKVFIVAAFAMGMISLGMEIYTESLPL